MKTAKEFYDFFSAIPEEKWTIGTFLSEDGRCCAMGHLGCSRDNTTAPGMALENIFQATGRFVTEVNDWFYPRETPKQRILAALEDAIKQGL